MQRALKGHLFAQASSSECVPLDVGLLLQVDLHKVALCASISTKSKNLARGRRRCDVALAFLQRRAPYLAFTG